MQHVLSLCTSVQRPVRHSGNHAVGSSCFGEFLGIPRFRHMRTSASIANGAATEHMSSALTADSPHPSRLAAAGPIRPLHPDQEASSVQHHTHKHPSLATLMVSCPDQKVHPACASRVPRTCGAIRHHRALSLVIYAWIGSNCFLSTAFVRHGMQYFGIRPVHRHQ